MEKAKTSTPGPIQYFTHSTILHSLSSSRGYAEPLYQFAELDRAMYMQLSELNRIMYKKFALCVNSSAILRLSLVPRLPVFFIMITAPKKNLMHVI